MLDIIHFGGECTFARRQGTVQMASGKRCRTFCLLLVQVRLMDTVKVLVAIELDDKTILYNSNTLHLLVRQRQKWQLSIHGRSYFYDVAFVNHPLVHCFLMTIFS